MKSDANVDFLTNAAVAWFAAGVIAPIFRLPSNLLEFLPYLVAAFASGIFIYLANSLERKQHG